MNFLDDSTNFGDIFCHIISKSRKYREETQVAINVFHEASLVNCKKKITNIIQYNNLLVKQVSE